MFKPTVDSIMKGFLKTLDKLESLSDACQTQIEIIEDKEADLARSKSKISEEYLKSITTTVKLRDLVGLNEEEEV